VRVGQESGWMEDCFVRPMNRTGRIIPAWSKG